MVETSPARSLFPARPALPFATGGTRQARGRRMTRFRTHAAGGGLLALAPARTWAAR